jgi:ankyrin repeat protein
VCLTIAQLKCFSLDGINRKDEKGYTVLHWAVIFDDLDLTVALLKENADINAKDSHNLTPLLLAFHNDKVRFYKLFS